MQDTPTAGNNNSSSNAATAVPGAVEVPQQEEEKFNWYRAWYPIAALEALKTDAPNAVHLLGMRLVLWQDKQGTWRCFEDLCPHRLAPLSEGRIHESGELQCTYHGWRFDEQGGCTSIPQIGDAKAHSTACSSGRACVKAFPAQVLQGMLWVFADSSPEGWKEATAADGTPVRPAAASTELLDKGWELKSPWFQRDIPLSFDVLLENMTDPAHVPQSHHGVVGDRESDQRMTIQMTTPVTKGGFGSLVTPAAGMGPYEVTYTAPSLVKYEFPGPTMLLYSAPSAKGWSRVVMSFVGPPSSKQTRPGTPQLPPLLNWFIDNIVERFPALQHALNRNAIVDGDTYFMHAAERTLYERGDHNSWSKQYYMPAAADAAVVSWRKWIDKFGSNLPVLPKSAADLPPLMTREQVFDRYHQHTQHCPHCQAALRNTEIAIGLLAIAGAVAAGTLIVAAVNAAAAAAATAGATTAAAAAAGGAALLPFGAAAKLAAAAAAVAAVAGAAVAGLLKFRQLFIFSDYVHAAT